MLRIRRLQNLDDAGHVQDMLQQDGRNCRLKLAWDF